MEAKKILLSECEKINLSSDISEFKKNRIGANAEQKHLKDILDIIVAIDFEKGGNLDTIFVAANPNRIPSPGRCNLLTSIAKLQQQSEAQKVTLDTVVKSLSALQSKTQSAVENSRRLISPGLSLDSLNVSLTTTSAPESLASSVDADNGAGSGKRKRNVSETNASPNLVSKARRGENDTAVSSAIRSTPSSLDPAPSVTPDSVVVLTAPPTTEPHSLTSDLSSVLAVVESSAPDGQPEVRPEVRLEIRPEIQPGVQSSTPPAPEAVTAALAAATAVGEAAKAHTNPIITSAVKSARKAAKAAKSAVKDAEASKAIAVAKEAAATAKKAEAAAAAASAKALKEAAAKSSFSSSLSASSSSSSSASSSSSSSESLSLSSESSSSTSDSLPSSSESSSSSLKSSSLSWLTKARKTKKIETIVGNREDGQLEGVAPRVKDFFDLFVSNLSETTTDFQLKTCLQGHAIEVKDVWLLNSKKKGTKSAKVRIAIEHRNKAKDAGIWSKHIHVKDWVRKPSTKSDV